MDATLTMAQQHVLRAEQIVAAQERLVADQLWRGQDTRQADDLLISFRGTLEQMREHLAWKEKRALHRWQWPPRATQSLR